MAKYRPPFSLLKIYSAKPISPCIPCWNVNGIQVTSAIRRQDFGNYAGGTFLFLRKNGTPCPDGFKIPGKRSVFISNRFIIKAHYLTGLKP
jgi:hypothetical protein